MFMFFLKMFMNDFFDILDTLDDLTNDLSKGGKPPNPPRGRGR